MTEHGYPPVDEEIDGCDQCGTSLAGESWTVIYAVCEGCGETHPVGVVHTIVCMRDYVGGEPLIKTQQRRAGLMRLN